MENKKSSGAVMLVKICGLTLAGDAAFAAECGADFLGIVMSETSPRRATPEQARAILDLPVPRPKYLVFGYDDTHYIENTFRSLALPETRLQVMADHPEIERLLTLAPAERVMPSISGAQKIDPAALARWEKFPLVLFDSHRSPTPRPPPHGVERGRIAGGTGVQFEVDNLSAVQRKFILAGGLKPDNVAGVVKGVRSTPLKDFLSGVDVASGVEKSPGIKDRDKIRRFIEGAKGFVKTPPRPSGTPPLSESR